LPAAFHFIFDSSKPIRIMKILLALTAVLTFASTVVRAEAPALGKDMNKAIHQAGAENKLAFILMGRESCANCNATKKMIREGKVPVTSAKFVMADINVDDARVSSAFHQKFGKLKFGNVLPFVVITDSKGKALAHYSGFKNAKDLTALVKEAEGRASAK
jgi:thioredoxin-related protein